MLQRIIVLLALLSSLTVRAQQVLLTRPSDTVRFILPSYRGAEAWEFSSDSLTWMQSESQGDSIELLTSTFPTWVRCRIDEAGCAPIYTHTFRIERTPEKPKVSKPLVAGVTSNSVTLNADVTDDGGRPILERGFRVGETSDFESMASFPAETESKEFGRAVEGLMADQKYYVRSFSRNEEGTGFSDTVVFRTLPTDVLLPTITTLAPVVGSTSAEVKGIITSPGNVAIQSKGFAISNSEIPSVESSRVINVEGDSFQSVILELTPGTAYHVRAFVIAANVVVYGNDLQFSTLQPLPPSAITQTVENITATSASFKGEVTNPDQIALLSVGFVLGSSPDVTEQNGTIFYGTAGSLIEVDVTGLTPFTLYYVRAFVETTSGKVYGNEVSFVTPAGAPQLTTLPVSSITGNGATLSATLTSTGGSAITSKGFVVGTEMNPTLETATRLFQLDVNSEAFQLQPLQLTYATQYHVRAFAGNSVGIAYGDEVVFTTAAPEVPTVLLFVSHEATYYTEYVVMKKALEAAGYAVETASANSQPASIYMQGYGDIPAAAVDLSPGATFDQFTTQFQHATGGLWQTDWNVPPDFIDVDRDLIDIDNLNGYAAFVVAGGTGALVYRLDGNYDPQGTGDRLISASEVELVAKKMNALAMDGLSHGKTVVAQCHAASLASFWRVPGTLGNGPDGLGTSLLAGRLSAGYPEAATNDALDPLDVVYRPDDKVVVSIPTSVLANMGLSSGSIVTTRDWYPQTVLYAARTLLNMLDTYPTSASMQLPKTVLILHGGAVDASNCSAANRSNDVPCNYGNAAAELPADYTQLVSLLSDSPHDDFSFTVQEMNMTLGSFPQSQQELQNLLDGFDVVLFFKHWSTGISQEFQNALVNYADDGGGIVGLHHALYNDGYGKNDIVNMFGVESSPWQSLADANRTTYRAYHSNYGHFVSTYNTPLTQDVMMAPIAWNQNPLPSTANSSESNFQNFLIYDEIYRNLTLRPGQQYGREVNQLVPLFSNDDASSPTQCHLMGFAKEFDLSGETIGRLVYLQAGERSENLVQNSPYGQIIRNALVWVSTRQ